MKKVLILLMIALFTVSSAAYANFKLVADVPSEKPLIQDDKGKTSAHKHTSACYNAEIDMFICGDDRMDE